MKPRFKVGQVVMVKFDKKPDMPVTILEVVEQYGCFFYRVDKKNTLQESMLRELTPEEIE